MPPPPPMGTHLADREHVAVRDGSYGHGTPPVQQERHITKVGALQVQPNQHRVGCEVSDKGLHVTLEKKVHFLAHMALGEPQQRACECDGSANSKTSRHTLLELYLIAQDLAANLEQGLQGRDHASNQGLILAMEEGNVVDDIQVALPHNLVSEVVRQLAKDGL